MRQFASVIAMAVFCLSTAGCGLTVPPKDALVPNQKDVNGLSVEGKFKSNLVAKIKCQMQQALFEADRLGTVPWLRRWGTQISLKMTWDERADLSGGLTNINLLKGMETFSTSVGIAGSAHATRNENVTFIWENGILLSDEVKNRNNGTNPNCGAIIDGPFLTSDLKIGEFVYDNAVLARKGVATTGDASAPPFTTFQNDLTFVASYGANVTPSWRFAKLTANSGAPFLTGQRTVTGELIITIGPLDASARQDFLKMPVRLAEPAASQHNAAVVGGFVATQNAAQRR